MENSSLERRRGGQTRGTSDSTRTGIIVMLARSCVQLGWLARHELDDQNSSKKLLGCRAGTCSWGPC
eukprot:378450-Hanusia_phi.AAC.5